MTTHADHIGQKLATPHTQDPSSPKKQTHPSNPQQKLKKRIYHQFFFNPR